MSPCFDMISVIFGFWKILMYLSICLSFNFLKILLSFIPALSSLPMVVDHDLWYLLRDLELKSFLSNASIAVREQC